MLSRDTFMRLLFRLLTIGSILSLCCLKRAPIYSELLSLFKWLRFLLNFMPTLTPVPRLYELIFCLCDRVVLINLATELDFEKFDELPEFNNDPLWLSSCSFSSLFSSSAIGLISVSETWLFWSLSFESSSSSFMSESSPFPFCKVWLFFSGVVSLACVDGDSYSSSPVLPTTLEFKFLGMLAA